MLELCEYFHLIFDYNGNIETGECLNKDNISKYCCKENYPLEPKIDIQWDSNYCCRFEEE